MPFFSTLVAGLHKGDSLDWLERPLPVSGTTSACKDGPSDDEILRRFLTMEALLV
jgi:hypothetical protein